jgi:hypothetical protein
MPEERYHRIGQEEPRKRAYERRAFQHAPHVGAWTSGWKDLPAQHSWLDLAIRARTTEEIPSRIPHGPRRPDRTLHRAVARRVADVDDGIEVNVARGNVALVGRVDSQRAKLRAQRRAGSVSGVRRIHNLLEVR